MQILQQIFPGCQQEEASLQKLPYERQRRRRLVDAAGDEEVKLVLFSAMGWPGLALERLVVNLLPLLRLHVDQKMSMSRRIRCSYDFAYSPVAACVAQGPQTHSCIYYCWKRTI